MMQAFRVGDRLGAVGYLGLPGGTPERAHCTLRVLF